jgi:predicted DNA-binding protein
MSAGRTFTKPTTIRVKPNILERVRAIADKEGNTEAAVLRRAIAAGLVVIGGSQLTASPDVPRFTT